MKCLKIAIYFLAFIISGFCFANSASAVTEFVSTVMQSGGDYSTLNTWETGVQTDLTSAATQVFSGTKTGTVADNTVVYLCRSGVYQSHSGTTVHAASSQILVELISGAATEQSGDIWYTNNTCDSANYFTISDGGDSAIAIAQIDGAWTSADTTAVTIDGWTTDATHYIKIYTTAAARHDGKWNTGKYRLLPPEYSNAITINQSNVFIDGLQLDTQGNDSRGIVMGNYSNLKLSNLIIKGVSGIYSNGIAADSWTEVKIWNNIIYGFIDGAGINFQSYSTNYCYNNTVYGNNMGITGDGYAIAKNNISYNNTTDFSGSFDASSNYNFSKDDTAPGANSIHGTTDGKTPDFINVGAGVEDFHLQVTSDAIGVGTDNPGSGLYLDDIDGQTRTSIWDIGADEAANNVFYSVGQNASNHCGPAGDGNDCGDVSIASGIATFTAAQAGTNLGVGDRLTAGGNVYYLASKTSTTVWNVVTALGAIPDNLGSTAVTSIAHEFTTLSSAIALSVNSSHINNTDLTAANVVLNIPCYYDSAADTTAVTVTGYTTGANNYIKIYTPNNTSTEANTSQRHSGKWNEGKYRLEVNWSTITINEEYVRIEGLQIDMSPTASVEWENAISISLTSTTDIRISDNIIKESHPYQNNWALSLYTDGGNVRVWNNLIYDFVGEGAIKLNAGTHYVYNNTIFNCTVGISRWDGNDHVVKNNLYQSNGIPDAAGYENKAYFSSFSDYNISDIIGDTTGISSSYRDGLATTVTFADEANDDFHLSPTDTSAKNAGANLYADASLPITTDIDNQARPDSATLFDIGADEAANNVFYSVGQDGETDRKVASNVTISSGVGTFVNAQTGNIGVGDRVTYETGVEHICYISAKQSTSVWNLVTATGAACPDHSSTDVVSIKREFTSLSSAIALSVNSSHINNTDLTTANVVLNLPCYNDAGAADTTAVTIDGYTTGPNNYIKIYTPNNTTTEANTSQRHNGVWDEGKYRMYSNGADNIRIQENYARIEGLQFESDGSTTYGGGNIEVTNTDSQGLAAIYISHNIGHEINKAVEDQWINGLVVYGDTTNVTLYAWNNIFYDFNGTGNHTAIVFNGGTSYFYNNTVVNSHNGFLMQNGTVTAKNNLSYNNTTDFVGTFDASSNYNFSKDDTAPGANSIHGITDGKTPDFVNTGAGTEDFHLQITSDARDVGVSDPGSGLFSDDIDDEERPGTWDIGADEQPGVVYHATEPRVEGLTDGLVLYQSFDGAHMDWSASSAEARDQSGNNNNGDVIGATAAAGKIGQALGFNGTSNYVSQGNPGSGLKTIAFWINADDITSRKIMDFDGTDQIEIDGSSNILATSFPGTTIIYVDGAVASTLASGWHYVAITDTTGVNGSAVDIGRVSSGYFDGRIDEARFYNRVLTSDEIGDLYRMGQVKMNKSWTDSLKNGLVGMWSFDGPDINWSTNTAYDRSGSIPANDGTISGATAAIGKRGQGLDFSNDDYINAGTGSSLDNLGPMTISAWIYPRTYGEDALGIIIEKNASNPGSWWLTFYLDQGRINFNKDFSGTNDLDVITSDNSYNFNQWNYITATWDGSGTASNVHIYINGVEASYVVQQNGDESAVSDTGSGVYIGGHATAYNLDSKLDEVRVYNRALNETEIGDLYRMGQVIIKR